MTTRVRLACILCLGLLVVQGVRADGEIFDSGFHRFACALDTDLLNHLPVQHGGRTAPLDTLSRQQLATITGMQSPEGVISTVAYLEIYFNAGAYLVKPIIQVRSRSLRSFIASNLQGAALESFKRTGRLAPISLVDEEALAVLLLAGRLEHEDLVATREFASLADAWGKLADRRDFQLLLERLSVRYSAFLGVGNLRMIPSSNHEAWNDANALLSQQASVQPQGRMMQELRDAWRSRKADRVNSLIADLRSKSESMASQRLLRMEVAYNSMYRGRWVWGGFALATLLLVVAVAWKRRWIRRVGLGCLAFSTLLLGGVFCLRWLISGRPWYLPPMMTQYEALVASALLGAVVILVIERFWPKTYLGLAGSFYATGALVCAEFMQILMPGKMTSELGALPGILSSRIMAAHVAIIVIGHALVGMTFVVSLGYMITAMIQGPKGFVRPSSSADLRGPAGDSALAILDRSNLLLAQLGCWCVVVGTILGAVWADFAWGRWWGWDPKETWALLTVLIYVFVLHIRFIVSDRYRGVVTALGCIVGCGAMLFNWFVVNYLLPGLHSYS